MERRMFLRMAAVLPFAAVTTGKVQGAQGEIRLIVRADDIGSCHAANVACIEVYRRGVARSVEVMVPCPWFNEAVEMLNANPGYDVGVHLTLTSEWTNFKWRPLTHCPSLVDEQGNFYPMVWPNPNIGPNCSIREANPRIGEVERELRAQIELAAKKIKSLTHLSAHMGFTGAGPDIAAVVDKLASEYKLPLGLPGAKGARMDRAKTPEHKVVAFVKMLDTLEPGLWIFVEHPGLDVPEMQAIGHKGYEDVATDRQGVTDMFTSPRAMEVIRRRDIKLLSYGDVLNEQQRK
jgi:chitin disaccharide deacetylase